jgi:hypothetical protein
LAAVLAAAPAGGQVETPTSAGPVAVLDTPVFRIPQMAKPPTIDGRMEAGEWEDASALSGFWYDRFAAHFMFLAPIQTQLQVYGAYDKQNLYIAYSSPVYPEKSWLRARGRYPDVSHHPQYGLIWDDHVELEIRPYPDNVKGFRMGLFKWFVNPIATTSDQYWSMQRGNGYRWQSKAKVRCEVTDSRWTLEMAIPLKEMRHGGFAGEDDDGRPIVPLPPPDGTAYRVWFARAIGGNNAFFNAYDGHPWNTTKTKMILDSKAPSFQINELGPIMEDTIDLELTVKNHNIRSETVRIGFFVENATGTIYSSYTDEQLTDGLLELVPGEVRKLRLRQRFPGISLNGNVLWFDVRSAGRPAKELFRTRLIRFHHMDGGRYQNLDGTETSFRWARIDVIARMRPPRRDFAWHYTYSDYKNRMSAVVDKGIYGASDEAKTAVEAKLVVADVDTDQRVVAEKTVPFRGDYACFLFDMPKLKRGRYRTSVLLFDQYKRIVGEGEEEPFYKGEFEWVRNRVGLNDVVWEPFEPLRPDGENFETLKHRFAVDASGLPSQIVIKPDVRDLPLELRGGDAAPTDAQLIEVGRGPQLRAPMRLEAVVGGRRVPAKVLEPAKLRRRWKSELVYCAKLRAGPLDVDANVQYDCDGAMTVRMTYGAAEPVQVDALELVADFTGLFDLAVSAAHGGGMSGADRLECSLPAGEGVVWDSAADVERPALYYTHFIPFLTFGSGDRAFTWIADSDEHWLIDRDGSTMSLERDAQGRVTWRVKFINHKTTVDGRRTVKFALLTQPAKPKPKGHRRLAYFQRGPTWAGLWGNMTGSDAELKAVWREASGAPEDLPDSARATYGKKDPPWKRWYQLRGMMPRIPAVAKNALCGDLYGRMKIIPATINVKRIINNKEQWITRGVGGGAATLGKAWQDLFVWYFGRHVRLARRHGWWWDETWPTYRSSNLAAGEAYLRDPNEVREKELPWQDTFLTFPMRGMFKRLARVFKESGVPLRNHLWANASATAFESFAFDTCLVESASSDHKSFELDNVVVYPNALFKYNAHHFTGLVARLVPRHADSTSTHSRAGDDKRLDRQLIGRALLNDIGMQPVGPHGATQHNDQCLRLINALIEFGYFADDARTEFLPYWRSGQAVRYGDGTGEHAKVYVTVFRRPVGEEDGGGAKALLVIMNESDEALRAPLHVLDAQRVFGGSNTLTVAEVRPGELPPAGSEELLASYDRWGRPRVLLKDVEYGLFLPRAKSPGGQERYDNVYVRPHNYRVLYGHHKADQ